MLNYMNTNIQYMWQHFSHRVMDELIGLPIEVVDAEIVEAEMVEGSNK